MIKGPRGVAEQNWSWMVEREIRKRPDCSQVSDVEQLTSCVSRTEQVISIGVMIRRIPYPDSILGVLGLTRFDAQQSQRSSTRGKEGVAKGE